MAAIVHTFEWIRLRPARHPVLTCTWCYSERSLPIKRRGWTATVFGVRAGRMDVSLYYCTIDMVDILSAWKILTLNRFESKVLGSLIEYHLVKRESDNLHLSVHRLVQFEFISQLTASKLQGAFNAVALLLYHAFPRQDIHDFMQSRWSLCTEYLPHVLSIVRFYKLSKAKTTQSRSRGKLHSLRPTMYFLRVMIHCSW